MIESKQQIEGFRTDEEINQILKDACTVRKENPVDKTYKFISKIRDSGMG